MSRERWLHVEHVPAPGEAVVLDPDEARHAGRVQRLRTGDPVVLADGQGSTARAELLRIDKREVRAVVQEVATHVQERPAIHVASAVPKGDRIGTLLSMLTQLGIRSFSPLLCERSVVIPSDEAPDRWHRIVRESAKQSRRAWLPLLRPPKTPHGLGSIVTEGDAWLLDPEGDPGALVSAEPERAHWIVVGPEGGFTEAERQAMQSQGARTARLGEGILRIETAAVAAVATLRATTQRDASERAASRTTAAGGARGQKGRSG